MSELVANPYGCGYLPGPMGVYISHCTRHHGDPVSNPPYASVTFECKDGWDCPCDQGSAHAARARDALGRALGVI